MYTAVIVVSCAALAVLSVLVHENDRLDQATKRNFYMTYLVIILGALSEWLSVFLNGAPMNLWGIHVAAKCADYILTPTAAILFVRQVFPRSKLEKISWGLLAVNAVLQITSVFSKWTFYVDEMNYYQHGKLNVLYIVISALCLTFVIFSFAQYGKQFRKQNRVSLAVVFAFVFAGIIVQEFISSEYRVIYLVLAIGSMMLYIHYCEYAQMKMEDMSSLQQKMLETDSLTSLLSRFAYSKAIDDYLSMPRLPEDLVVLSVDLNGLKKVNDTLGHSAGDQLIINAARCIKSVLGEYGDCYRTGGDEFFAFLKLGEAQIPAMKEELKAAAEKWSQGMDMELSFSVGVSAAVLSPSASIEQLIQLADKAMYQDKNDYYRTSGKDRRTR